jgi:nitrogen fixation NifU-like protein
MENREMYQEHVLDHYREPQNFGNLKSPTHKSHSFNPICGDDVTITLEIKDDKVEDVKFDGKGCAISIAAASLVTDAIKGKTLKEVMKINTKDILEMLGIEVSAPRIKCALIALETIHNAIKNKEDNIIGDDSYETT